MIEIYSPVLLVISENPENAWRSFEVIKKVKPLELFISGNRNEVDKIASNVNWPCKLELNNSEQALSWFFSKAEEGIIVQDKSNPDASFFFFAQAMLERYRAKKEVVLINGANPEGTSKSKFSYFFSHIGIGGAWATWKRAWLSHQSELQTIFKQGLYLTGGELMSLVPKNNLIEFQNIQGDIDITPIDFPLTHQIIFNIESEYDKSTNKKLKI
jgi:hypothetical protein